MTATPLELVLKNKQSNFTNDETTYSMNNPTIYGTRVYEYTFYQGIKDGYLTPFDMVYLQENKTNEIPDDLKKEISGKSKIEKQQIYFKYISSFLLREVKKFNLKHILVYLQDHAKIELMKDWLEYCMKQQQLEYEIFSITSDDSKTKRKNNLTLFRENTETPKILLSVAIFNEGVDEPCIDSVMFAQERNSDTTIAQNIGRCLRIYNGKHKSYVLIPNIMYEYDDEDQKAMLSSRFKRIREVAKILNKDIKNHYFKKNIKGVLTTNKDNDSYDDKLDLCDEIDVTEIHNNIDNENNIDKSQVIDLSEYYTTHNTNNDISNKTLLDIKDLVNKHNLKTLKQYGEFCRTNGMPFLYLHEDFKREWTSWGEFLCDKTYTYEEAKQFIKNYIDLSNINTSEEFVNYYHDILKNELNARHQNLSEKCINEFCIIPNRPAEYYKGDWIDWEDFLGKLVVKKVLKINESGNSTKKLNAEANLKNLMNGDKAKISFVKNDFNDIKFPFNLDIIKKYFDNLFEIDCEIVPRVKTNSHCKYDSCILNIARKEDKYSKRVPIVLVVDTKCFSYDPDLGNIPQLLKKEKCDRTQREYLKNTKEMNDVLFKIIEHCKNKINECQIKIKQNDEVTIKNTNVILKEIKNDVIEKKPTKKKVQKEQEIKKKPTLKVKFEWDLNVLKLMNTYKEKTDENNGRLLTMRCSVCGLKYTQLVPNMMFCSTDCLANDLLGLSRESSIRNHPVKYLEYGSLEAIINEMLDPTSVYHDCKN